ncbi:4-alpha-glucanotransferase [Pseudoalteromonas sp. McH1-7]|uniref:4-alpha-glucanotransferase n=1 Tax=Pseudoalteromonas sp. McH1-7 TaxID=2745574 RepID=UPI0015905B08|nr:4-alpha-glucanotransferase [Pseudoalteromonas sp. McH1-7]NUZ10107.1 4-alpha-glucanotransferase [Pseudoalteromonas sp. McH1-7]
MDHIAQLLYLYGIGYEYHKYTGDHVIFDHQTRLSALKECGVNTDDIDEVNALNFTLDIAKWLTPIEAITLTKEAQPKLTLRLEACSSLSELTISIPALNYHFVCECNNLSEVGDYVYQGTRYVALSVAIAPVVVGYHQAKVTINGQCYETELWVTPEHCYDPISDNKKLLGISVQLYSLKPENSKLSADFFELKELIVLAAGEGVDYILLNPLHLLFVEQPEKASPYSPNDRRLLHPFYISIELLCERFNVDKNVFFKQSNIDKSDRNHSYLDMSRCMNDKLAKLHSLWQYLQNQRNDWDADFKQFCQRKKEELSGFTDDEFARFLQWVAFEQLAHCQLVALEHGMAIGLINDLAVGCADGSSEYESNRSLYAEHARVGAPPDPWAEQGQNWGLPALNPVKLKAERFEFFKQLIRANISGVGGLRIDHVMGLRRLWWCFVSGESQSGCYVYYPFEYLLAILKIESALHKVMVIGEDLGVVPTEIKLAMAESHIYSNILFYFEKDHDDQFLAVEHYKKNALLMVANHDVPPFFGWWEHDDLRLKKQYQLLDERQTSVANAQRETERDKLCRWLSLHGVRGIDLKSEAALVYPALIKVLAQSPAKMLTLQLDDLDCQRLPVNIPGTDKEYPNWRRQLTQTSTEIIAKSQMLIRDAVTSRNL